MTSHLLLLFYSLLFCQRLFIRESQENETQQEEDSQGSDRDVDRTAGKLDPCDYRRAEERRSFGKNIVDAEVFSGVLRGNDLGEVTSGEGLDRSLEAADAKREDAEIDQCVQRQRVDTDAEISDDTGQDQRNSVKLLGKLSEYERSAKSNNLRSQKENDLSDGGKPQIRADVDAVVDNGAYAVDIEEEGDPAST